MEQEMTEQELKQFWEDYLAIERKQIPVVIRKGKAPGREPKKEPETK